MEGKQTTVVAVKDLEPIDTEALSVANCGGNRSCLYIGDIGDNDRRRQTIEVVVIEEMQTFQPVVMPRQRLKFRYPDGPHDAESMAIHPNGTIFVLTKEQPPRLYRGNSEIGTQTLVPVMTLDTGGFSPTDMAISDDGTRLIVLTYLYAIEIGLDLTHPSAPRYKQRIAIQPLQQEESIAYLAGSRSFIYTTESRGLPAWIMRVDCGSVP